MEKASVKNHILAFLQSHGGWRFGGTIEDYIRELLGAKASNASRRCRELVQAGAIEERYVQVNGRGPHVVQYRIRFVSQYQSGLQQALL